MFSVWERFAIFVQDSLVGRALETNAKGPRFDSWPRPFSIHLENYNSYNKVIPNSDTRESSSRSDRGVFRWVLIVSLEYFVHFLLDSERVIMLATPYAWFTALIASILQGVNYYMECYPMLKGTYNEGFQHTAKRKV